MSKNYLIYSDIHNRIGLLDGFLKRNGDLYEERYFLGDYFDQFNDTPDDVLTVAKYVKQLLEDPRNHLCLGNHDIDYMFPWNNHVWCPGFSIEKSQAINSILTPDDWAKMKLFFIVDKWILSHAGIHPSFLGDLSDPAKVLTDIQYLCDSGMNRIANGQFDLFLMPGMDRGFRTQQHGGILWLDWSKFKAIKGINQIVGHTIIHSPQVRFLDEKGRPYYRLVSTWGAMAAEPHLQSINWCLDTNNRHFAVIEDGVMHVYETQDFL